MGFLKDGKFWGGVMVGVLLLTVFPQFNLRTVTAGGRVGG